MQESEIKVGATYQMDKGPNRRVSAFRNRYLGPSVEYQVLLKSGKYGLVRYCLKSTFAKKAIQEAAHEPMSDEQPVALCDHTGCFARATTRGLLSGRYKDSGNKDSIITVNACREHSQQHGFIDLKEVPIIHE